MKRTNLVLDERLLVPATQVLAAKTYSAAVNTALEEVIRPRKIQSIPHLFGSGIWVGDLSQRRQNRLRDDAPHNVSWGHFPSVRRSALNANALACASPPGLKLQRSLHVPTL